jgi:hypothetical protein
MSAAVIGRRAGKVAERSGALREATSVGKFANATSRGAGSRGKLERANQAEKDF